jgi:hypothetical protein
MFDKHGPVDSEPASHVQAGLANELDFVQHVQIQSCLVCSGILLVICSDSRTKISPGAGDDLIQVILAGFAVHGQQNSTNCNVGSRHIG